MGDELIQESVSGERGVVPSSIHEKLDN